jgi:hypothetical protein
MIRDRFLVEDRMYTEKDAISRSFEGALQHNPTYSNGVTEAQRRELRTEWARLLREVSLGYVQPKVPISDTQHCDAIRVIADRLSSLFGQRLLNQRLRFGTSQKALNLYLKYLWKMGSVSKPPHCPLDSIVLAEGGIKGKWTKCDSEQEYMERIHTLRKEAEGKHSNLVDWEYGLWLDRALRKRSRTSNLSRC